jgi:nascent polypeptide-associated complex subunit beta
LATWPDFSDEKKLEETLKKLNVQPVNQVEEVNMFQKDGKIIHFTRPQGEQMLLNWIEWVVFSLELDSVLEWFLYPFYAVVVQDHGCFLTIVPLLVTASVSSNTFVVKGTGFNKDMTQLLPGILTQLGPETLDELRMMAQQFQKSQANAATAGDDEIPELLEAGDGADADDVPELVEA